MLQNTKGGFVPSLIITSDTISVKLRSERLELIRRDESGSRGNEPLCVPLHELERVVICGCPAVTMPVFHKLMQRNIPVVFLTSHGRWLGGIESGRSIHSARRIRQYEIASELQARNRIAARLIDAKIRNSRRVLQRFSATRNESRIPVQLAASSSLWRFHKAVCSGVPSADSLRGLEGMAAVCYFRRLADFFPESFPFQERSRRPPRNEANCLLSWTYAVVLGEIESCVRAHGLDPGIGFLHTVEHSMPALALDLLEPLRAPLCDMLVLHLLNHRILRKEHFRSSEKDGGVYLEDSGKKIFFIAYEQTMTRKFKWNCETVRVDFRRVIEREVLSVISALEGEGSEDYFIMP